MAKLTINLLGYNHRDKIGAAIESVLAQSFGDYELWYTDNDSVDGSADFVRKHYPQVKVFVNKKNLGYAGGHNGAFGICQTELVMVLNPDVVLDKDYLKNLLPVFFDSKVAAATGKLLKPAGLKQGAVLDGTGIVVGLTRRAVERGQNQLDYGQYDKATAVFGVSGTAAVYRRAALEKVKLPSISGGAEYFDEDFFAYWEDFDLSWRLRLSGYVCRFVPQAIAYHQRLAGRAPGGYKRVKNFIAHHRKLPLTVKQWNWKNHLFCIVKNDFGWPFWLGLPFVFFREIMMFVFILCFERDTLKIWPELVRQLPTMLKKRNYIKRLRVVSGFVAAGWFFGKYD